MTLQKIWIATSMLALLQLGGVAQAAPHSGYHGGGGPHGGFHGPYHGYHHGPYFYPDPYFYGPYPIGYEEVDVDSSCSPQMKQKNVDLMETAVKKVAAGEDFAKADVFQETLQQIQGEKNIDKRIAQYCDLVGVDYTKNDQLAEFIGARDHSSYIDKAAQRLQLDRHQADQLVTALTKTLLGGVNSKK